jgi:hypothetical protein
MADDPMKLKSDQATSKIRLIPSHHEPDSMARYSGILRNRLAIEANPTPVALFGLALSQ